ncbi:PspC domain-containing protein [Actinokineospora inagensis]|uniref:PspC domain-containing protein n=1 Tax=Actinokineospora inagensis TaxID=103730 RepID=UPI00146FAF20|nr:PspC domain-containing protein [Actinokineospora inagensis]
MSGTANQARHTASSVEDTLKDFWASRPRRPRQGRKLAGVAAGIGSRYGVDPIIIRVAFAVATFYGGAGIAAYLIGWLLFAEVDDEVSPVEALLQRGRSATSPQFAVALVVGVIATVSIGFDFEGYVGFAVVLGLLFLLHRYRGQQNRPVPEQAAQAAPVMTMPFPVDETTEVPTPMTVNQPPAYQPVGYPTEPPAWDPLGAAPFAWDLPEPAAPMSDPEPPTPRRRSKVGPVTLAVVFLAVGVSVLFGLRADGWFSVRHLIGGVLAILGLGLVVGGFTRGGRGLIGLAMPLAALGIAMTVVWPNGFRANAVGDVHVTPQTLADVRSDYSRDIGSVAVDLSALPKSGSVDVTAEAGVGEVDVIVPATADVTVYCEAGIGDVDCLGESRSGTDTAVRKTDLGTDGEGGLKIELRAEVHGPGNVRVTRG